MTALSRPVGGLARAVTVPALRAAALCLAISCGPADAVRDGPPETDPPEPSVAWLLGPEPAVDLIRAGDDEAELRRRFGNENVRTDTVWVGEGMFELGTMLYPADPHRRLAVQWADTVARARPEYVRLEDEHSIWRLHPGVGLGTSLRQLEELNAGPFDMYGFGWDYGGTVADWRGGRLGELWGDRVIVRLRPRRSDRADLEQQVLGERIYTSSSEVMRALEPEIYAVLVRPR